MNCKTSLLNGIIEDIHAAYASAFQYTVHAAAITGPEYQAYKKDLTNHIADDIGQAVALSDTYVFLGGNPENLLIVKDSQNINTVLASAKTMLVADKVLQENAISRYKKQVLLARECFEFALASYYEGLIGHEQEHLKETLQFLGE